MMTVAAVLLIAAALAGLFFVRRRSIQDAKDAAAQRMPVGSPEHLAYLGDQRAIAKTALLSSIDRGEWALRGNTLVRVTALIAVDRLPVPTQAAALAALVPGPARTQDDIETTRMRSFDASKAVLPVSGTVGGLSAMGTVGLLMSSPPASNAEVLAHARTAAELAEGRIRAQHLPTFDEAVAAGTMRLNADGSATQVGTSTGVIMASGAPRAAVRREHNRDGSITVTYSDGTTERTPAP